MGKSGFRAAKSGARIGRLDAGMESGAVGGSEADTDGRSSSSIDARAREGAFAKGKSVPAGRAGGVAGTGLVCAGAGGFASNGRGAARGAAGAGRSTDPRAGAGG